MNDATSLSPPIRLPSIASTSPCSTMAFAVSEALQHAAHAASSAVILRSGEVSSIMGSAMEWLSYAFRFNGTKDFSEAELPLPPYGNARVLRLSDRYDTYPTLTPANGVRLFDALRSFLPSVS
uniref:Uncharacterized protein n=1 Tax=Sphaerodactylus townsendi TaxID=933632 RepID=A0ACB8EZJ0_9SAUR